MSLKQEGNAAFKSQNYKEAIRLYDLYVSQQHPDNKNAYFNMGLCYSKLNKHIESIEACTTAANLDPTYEKAYYRLMKQYENIHNNYQVFINARQYVKYQKDQNSAQVSEAWEKAKKYYDKFIAETKKTQTIKKMQEKDQFFDLIGPLNPTPSQQFNEQIDKYPQEWLDEWAEGVQSEDAKWEEIAYVARDLDTSTGISLAYLYLNQQTIPIKRRQIGNKIKELKVELNFHQPKGENTMTENSAPIQLKAQEDQIAQQLEHIELAAEAPKQEIKQPKIDENKKSQNINKKQNTEMAEQVTQKGNTQTGKNNKIQQLLEKKSQNKKAFDDPELDLNKETPKYTKQVKNIANPKQEKKQQKKVTNQVKTQEKPQPSTKPVPPPKVSSKQQLSEEELQQLYKFYCANLEKPKDIFVQAYKSIFSVLSSKQGAVTKGHLLILIKKRLKKFKLIMASFSDNEQKVIFDLLTKHNMEEYAIDFAPKHYKPQ